MKSTKPKHWLDNERANLEDVQAKASNDDFLKLEQDLANTRARFLIADQTLEQTKLAQDSDILQEMAQKEYDSALADLENYQRKYRPDSYHHNCRRNPGSPRQTGSC